MRIQNKLFAVIIVSSTIVVGAMMALAQWSIDRGMLDYVNTRETEQAKPLLEALASSYSATGSWQTIARQPEVWHQLLRQHFVKNLRKRRPAFKDDQHSRPPPPRHHYEDRPPPPPRDKPRAFRMSPPKGVALLDEQLQLVAGSLPHGATTVDMSRVNQLAINVEVLVEQQLEQQLVGWLVFPKREKITEGFELQFLQQQREAFMIISLLVIGLAIIVALPLARHFVRPINRLADGTEQLTGGHYELQLDTDRGDELGQLARDFNQLAITLKENESNRKRWLADISHELRTPLAILKGELEAIIDGVRAASPENLLSLQQEIDHLNKLIDDLYQLSNSEIGGMRYSMEPLDLRDMLAELCKHHQAIIEAAGLQFRYDSPHHAVTLLADSTRLHQLFDNLLENSLKYTDAPGAIHISLTTKQGMAVIDIEDSTPGVPGDALDKVFDHLFRVDDSRNRRSGGSGLGLSLCRQIVTAHGGTISARHSSLGGLHIAIRLPLAD